MLGALRGQRMRMETEMGPGVREGAMWSEAEK